jgi:hypothetical protein
MTKDMMVKLGIGSFQWDRLELTKNKKAKIVGRKQKTGDLLSLNPYNTNVRRR